MPAPAIILPRPYIMLTQSAGTFGITPKQGLGIGYVELVYDTSDSVQIGTYVWYEASKASSFVYGSTQYYIVRDEYVITDENYIAPP